ncbi:MAG: sulfotransferase domain-containing protein [Sulfuricaulis sp.]
MDQRNRLLIKLDALQRLLMVNCFSGILPLYIVTEYPKSGGSWVAQMLSAYLDAPFPRNERPKFTRCVMHGHYLHAPFMRNVLCVVRDGRDVVVSAYYHMLFENEKNSSHLVEQTRRLNPFADYEDITENLPRFIEYLFTVENKQYMHFNWNQFIDSWYEKPDATVVKYSHLLADTANSLRPYIEKVTGEEVDMMRLRQVADDFSFERLSKRVAGEEDIGSFLRKGIAGDWKNKFDKAACEAFDYYAGDNLIRLGFEKDRGWISQHQVSDSQEDPPGLLADA